ncbi:MAG TPA: carboxypeptidase-like regulatory domain-containing protein [Gemmatimonadaceae bacterium]|nr:carboxypeptidase-like regulatory domain-containing protein [Gemmatimonadaceae bacterium]
MQTRHGLVLLGGLVALPLATIGAQGPSAPTSQTYTVSGVVRDDAQAPVSNAELKLTRDGQSPRLTRTGADGRFGFEKVQSGAVHVSVRRLGYKATTKDVSVAGQTTAIPVDFALETAATDVEPVYVEGENDKMHEFYERQRTNNFGKYFDAAEIRQREPRLMSDLLRTIPGATISSANRVQNRVLLRGCRPTIWENGMKAYGAELDDVANPVDIAGMEVYLSWAGLPPQYQDRENPGCGAILVWTRDH